VLKERSIRIQPQGKNLPPPQGKRLAVNHQERLGKS